MLKIYRSQAESILRFATTDNVSSVVGTLVHKRSITCRDIVTVYFHSLFLMAICIFSITLKKTLFYINYSKISTNNR